MTDEAALMRAVLDHPHDDLPRLAYADWLEENAETAACGRCGGDRERSWQEPVYGGFVTVSCPSCGGTGYVADARAERAEFIRVQCELARIGNPHPDSPKGSMCGDPACPCIRRWPLGVRERKVWAGHGRAAEWFPDIGMAVTIGQSVSDAAERAGLRVAFIRRGFVEAVTLPLATFREHAAALFAAHPLLEVRLSDAVVYPSGGNDTYYLGGLGWFPVKYWGRLENLPSRLAVLDAASAVCVAWGRERAGLAPV